MRLAIAAIIIMVLAGTAVYAAPFGSTPTVNALAGGTTTVPHCQVLDFSIAASDTITSVNTNVVCDTTDSFNVDATVNSGASSGSGSTLVEFTADLTEPVVVGISPSVAIGSQVYDIDINVRR